MFGSRPASSTQRRPASTTSRTQPATTQSAPPAAAAPQQSGGMLSGIGSTIAQGMAFGTGSAIAHRAVGAVAGSFGGSEEKEGVQGSDQQQQQQGFQSQGQEQLQGSCAQDKQMFFECLKVNQGDQQSCSFLYNTLQECQRSDSQMSFQ